MQYEPMRVEPPDPSRSTPQVLYKYRECADDESKMLLRSILIDHELYFSTRARFNDPFDCLVPSFKDVPKAAMDEFIKQRLGSMGLQPDLSDIIKMDRLQKDIQDAVDKIGMLCLTEDATEMLMWGHYAKSHTGVCLAFSISSNEAFFGPAQPVVYSPARPSFDPKRSEQENAEAAVLTKSINWMYEREWRIFNTATGAGNYPFPHDKLIGVTLGYRMEKKYRDEVMQLVMEGVPGAKVYEAFLSEREYKMRLSPVT